MRNTRPRPRRKQIAHPPRIHLPPTIPALDVRQLRHIDARCIPHIVPVRHAQAFHLAIHLVRALRRAGDQLRPVRRRRGIDQRFREPVAHGAGLGVAPHPRVPVEGARLGVLQLAARAGHGGGAVAGGDAPGFGEALLALAGDAVGGGAVGPGHGGHGGRGEGGGFRDGGGGAEGGGPGGVFGGEEGRVGGGERGVGGGGPGGEGGVGLGVVGADGGEFGGGGGLVELRGPGCVLLGLGGEGGGGDGVVVEAGGGGSGGGEAGVEVGDGGGGGVASWGGEGARC